MNEIFKNTEILEQDNVLSGPFRKPFNEHLQAQTSIHNDETAQQLGIEAAPSPGHTISNSLCPCS